MKARLKKLIKYPITIWMLVSIALLGTMIIVRAAYSGTANVKRVVSSQASSNTVFSSNYLDSGELIV